MSANKYPRIFSRQMEAIVYISNGFLYSDWLYFLWEIFGRGIDYAVKVVLKSAK